ncbi:MAG: hypothetical protein LBN43_06255, partial [Oscillospiraceae bacterium]|nr:hypothetical protein [Oscillospiraceae bacterium]
MEAQLYKRIIPLYAILIVYSLLSMIVYTMPNKAFEIVFNICKSGQCVVYALAIACNTRKDLTYSRFFIRLLLIL